MMISLVMSHFGSVFDGDGLGLVGLDLVGLGEPLDFDPVGDDAEFVPPLDGAPAVGDRFFEGAADLLGAGFGFAFLGAALLLSTAVGAPGFAGGR
jgi:hypothetical protein